ncbi:MAG: hypothetical protein EPO31_05705 [Gammaproteobacteria bacterium]|jgi:hypothetical protein|nr:MAG: hypothetical protein EPO31_05705 [Gammaproteobacteria bacterium]
MLPLRRLAGLMVYALVAISSNSIAEDEHPPGANLNLSLELMELLRGEMQALLVGANTLPGAIAAADWENVARIGKEIQESYILEKQLSKAQREELESALPDHFKRLDGAFHEEAAKLAAAAGKHDAELSAFHFYRLIEACTTCHALYTPARFPGFSQPEEHAHDHE